MNDSLSPMAASPEHFGARLRTERERQGLSVGDVVARLRLHPKQVRALEEADLSVLPEPAYVRGFVRSYALSLGLAPEPLLADLATRLGQGTPNFDAMADDSPRSPVREAAREQNSRRIVLIGAMVLLAVLGALGWYASRPAPAPAPVVAPAPAPAPAPLTPVVPAPVAEAVAPPASGPASAAAGQAVVDASTASVPVAPLLKLSAKSRSWVRVEGSDKVVLLETTLEPGAEEVIEGIPPLAVVIGDASAVKLELRGQPIDLAPHTQRNIARLTLE
jgi:cytoskeleton protein RodZ